MSVFRVVVLALGCLLAANVTRAAADIITFTTGFLATGFGPNAPVDPVRGYLSITFDNSATLRDQTTGIALSIPALTLDTPPAYGYGHVSDVLVIGAALQGAQTLGPDTNDVLFAIRNASSNPTAGADFVYAQAGLPEAFKGTFQLTPVPEPGTLLLLGVGAAVAARRRQRAGRQWSAEAPPGSSQGSNSPDSQWRTFSAN